MVSILIVGVELDKLSIEKQRLVKEMNNIFNRKVSTSRGLRSVEKKITNVTVEEMLQQFTI